MRARALTEPASGKRAAGILAQIQPLQEDHNEVCRRLAEITVEIVQAKQRVNVESGVYEAIQDAAYRREDLEAYDRAVGIGKKDLCAYARAPLPAWVDERRQELAVAYATARDEENRRRILATALMARQCSALLAERDVLMMRRTELVAAMEPLKRTYASAHRREANKLVESLAKGLEL